MVFRTAYCGGAFDGVIRLVLPKNQSIRLFRTIRRKL
jgi:hypothetical protein